MNTYKKAISWITSLGLPLVIYLIPTNDTFTAQIRLFLALTIMAILFFAYGNVSQGVVAFLLPVAYVLFGVTDSATAYSAWTMPVFWLIVGSLVFVNVLNNSGILLRISYKIIILTGGTYKKILLGLGLLGIILNIVLYGAGYIPLVAIAYGLVVALDLGKSKTATGVFLASAIAGAVPGIFIYGQSWLIAYELGRSVTGPITISWFEYFFKASPYLLFYILCFVFIYLMFKPDRNINGREYFKNKLEELGPLTSQEKKATVYIVILLAYFMIAGYMGKDTTYGLIVVPLIMCLPGIGVGGEQDIRALDMSFILFVAACLSIGNIASQLGLSTLVADLTLPLLDGRGPAVVLFAIWLLTFLLNFILTPFAILAGFTGTFAQIAINAGIDPFIGYLAVFGGSDQIIFPYEYATYLLYFSFGYITMKDFIKFFSVKSILCVSVLIAIAIPFWSITGMMYS